MDFLDTSFCCTIFIAIAVFSDNIYHKMFTYAQNGCYCKNTRCPFHVTFFSIERQYNEMKKEKVCNEAYYL